VKKSGTPFFLTGGTALSRYYVGHLYWDLDPETTYRILHENIDDLKRFQDVVVDFLNKKVFTSAEGEIGSRS
jgi:hypothetical protein